MSGGGPVAASAWVPDVIVPPSTARRLPSLCTHDRYMVQAMEKAEHRNTVILKPGDTPVKRHSARQPGRDRSTEGCVPTTTPLCQSVLQARLPGLPYCTHMPASTPARPALRARHSLAHMDISSPDALNQVFTWYRLENLEQFQHVCVMTA